MGVCFCYAANGGAAGREFLDRLTALGFVLVVRFVALTSLVLLIGVAIVWMLNPPWRPSYEELDLMSVALFALFWWRLRTAVRSVATAGLSAEHPH